VVGVSDVGVSAKGEHRDSDDFYEELKAALAASGSDLFLPTTEDWPAVAQSGRCVQHVAVPRPFWAVCSIWVWSQTQPVKGCW
jgi:hypothetical protein